MTADIALNSSTGSFLSAGHYSRSTTAGGFIFVSGQLLVTLDSEKKAGASLEDQTRLILGGIDTCLTGTGVSRQYLVSVRVYVTDMNQWSMFNKIYGEWIGDFCPSRVVAGVAELHYGLTLEVEAIALAPQT